MYFKPYDAVAAGGDFPLSTAQLHEANVKHRDRHRIVVFTGASEYEVAALMRHELEHVRQQIRLGDSSETLLLVQERTTDVLSDVYGARLGSARLYNLIPMEWDANAAGAAFVASTYGDVAKAVSSGEHAQLFRKTARPGSLEDLGLRSLAFAGTHAPVFRSWDARNGQTVEGLFESWVDDVERSWTVLEGSAEVRGLARASVDASPSDDEIARAVRPPEAWARSYNLLEQAHERALALIR